MAITITGTTITGGVIITSAGGGGGWATINSGNASPELTIVGNEISITGDLSSSVGLSITNGSKLINSTASYSFEVLVNRVGGPSPYFYAGLMGSQVFNNSQWPTSSLGYGYGFGPGPGTPRLWNWDYSGSQAFLSPEQLVVNNDVLGITADFNGGTTATLNLYLNGVNQTASVPANFNGVAGNLVAIVIGWRFTSYNDPSTGSKVTLRTDPSTFSYGGSYTNQNGWPI